MKKSDSDKQTRKDVTPIKVYAFREERAIIDANAREAGMDTSPYLRLLGMGYEPKSIVDNKQVEILAKINGDLGRLGGLLKLWLTNDPRTAQIGESTIRAALARIETTQNEMVKVMRQIVRPRMDDQ